MLGSLTRTEVSRLLGISPKTLYLWERSGRVPPPGRDHRGWRAYGPADVEVLRQQLGSEATPPDEPAPERSRLEGLSARNQLAGTIVSLRGDGLLCEVVLRLGDGQEISSVITERSATRLGLKKGQVATAVIKATEVMVFR